MDISSSLLAKGAAGALAATTAIGGGVWANKQGLLGNLFAKSTAESGDLNSESVPEPDSKEPSATPTHQPIDTVNDNHDSNGGGSSNNLGEGAAVTGPDSHTNTGQDQVQDSEGRGSSPGGGTLGVGSEALQNEEEDEDDQDTNTSKWDKALIDYLKDKSGKNDRDITFAVKTGKNADKDLSNTFPDFEDEENTQKSIVTVIVTTTSSSLTGADSTSEIQKLKDMNNNQEWTWECKIIFKKNKGNDGFDFEDKGKLIGNNGFFNELTQNNKKRLKIKFIKNCAKTRNDNNSAALIDSKITSEKIFDLENTGTAWRVKQEKFNNWFSTSIKIRKPAPAA